MKMLIKVFVVLLALSLIVSACSEAPVTTQTATQSTPTQAPAATSTVPAATQTTEPTATPTPAVSKPTGTLTVALTELKLENWLPNEDSILFAISSTYEFLMYRDEDGNAVPGLAESWDISPDGLTYTFHLRNGIQFHDDWGELTADDVKFSYELGTSEGTVNASMKKFAPVVGEVEVVDRYTVVFHLNEPSVFFSQRLGREATPSFPILSKKHIESVGLEKANKHPVGSGPYKFVEHVFGDHITFEAVENHWRQTPAFKTLILRKVAEQATRVNMLRAGEVDMADISSDFVPEVLKAGLKIKSSPGSSGYLLNLGGQYYASGLFDTTYPWIGDPKDPIVWERALKVRKALALAVNKEEIRKALLAESTPLKAPYILYPGIPGDIPGLEPYPYDPAEARRLLAEAGYSSGFDITLRVWETAGRAEGPTIGQAVANMWKDIGVRVKLEVIEYQVARGMMAAKDPKAFAWIYAPLLYEEPVMGYGLLATSKNNYAWAGYDHPKLEEFIAATDAEPDSEKRAEIERQITQFVYDTYFTIPIGANATTWAVNDRVGDWKVAPSMNYPTNFESITHGSGFKP